MEVTFYGDVQGDRCQTNLSVGLYDVTLDLVHGVRSVRDGTEMEALEDHFILRKSAWTKNVTMK